MAVYFSVLLLCVATVATDAKDISANQDSVLKNSRVNCSVSTDQSSFEVIPGGGWDNLANRPAGRVLAVTYNNCRYSEDGRFLIPDGVELIPQKKSNMKLYSEIFDHYANFTSVTSRSINAEASFGMPQFSISGKFSSEHEEVKEKQISSQSVATRVQLRYHFYSARFQPDSPLAPAFRNRILDLAAEIANNRGSQRTYYLAEMLVRDYGTHVTNSIEAGALIAKVDTLKKDSVNSVDGKTDGISVSASASFYDKLHVSGGFSQKTEVKQVDAYDSNVSSTEIVSLGGSSSFGSNFSLADWESSLQNNLVAIDRSGDPLFYVLSERVFPELPDKLLSQVKNAVKAAITRYYQANAIIGCMDFRSPNFNPDANVDSGNCTTPKVKFLLGGVFQTCVGLISVCQDLYQANPLTGRFNCPQGYKSAKIFEGEHSSYENCTKSWNGVSHCETHSNSYATYWCVPTDKNSPTQQGFLFGGLYTKDTPNPITNTFSCPQQYMEFRMGVKAKICLTDDIELGSGTSIPFGGFYSCSQGNPLVLDDKGVRLRSKLRGNNQEGPDSESPKICPIGFSTHVAFIEQTCQINYCVLTNAFRKARGVNLRRPPFFEITDTLNSKNRDETSFTGTRGRVWSVNSDGNWVSSTSIWHKLGSEYSSAPGISQSTLIIIVSAVATLVLGLVVIAAVFGRRYRRSNSRNRRADYQTINGDTTETTNENSPLHP